jgi:hypothetical protein
LVEVDRRVGDDRGTRVVESTSNGTVKASSNSRQMDHAEVATRHELNSHILPCSRRHLVATPFNVTCLALFVDDPGPRCGRDSIGADEENGGGGEESRQSECYKHFLR